MQTLRTLSRDGRGQVLRKEGRRKMSDVYLNEYPAVGVETVNGGGVSGSRAHATGACEGLVPGVHHPITVCALPLGW